jgi:hypothetical protein
MRPDALVMARKLRSAADRIGGIASLQEQHFAG